MSPTCVFAFASVFFCTVSLRQSPFSKNDDVEETGIICFMIKIIHVKKRVNQSPIDRRTFGVWRVGPMDVFLSALLRSALLNFALLLPCFCPVPTSCLAHGLLLPCSYPTPGSVHPSLIAFIIIGTFFTTARADFHGAGDDDSR